MAEINSQYTIEEDQEMAKEPIYHSSGESEHSTPNTIPEHHEECIYIESINQLKASQLEQQSHMGTETVFYLRTPNTSMIFDDEDQSNLTPVFGYPEQYPSPFPQRCNHPIQLCQHVQPIPDTPESPPLEDQGPSDIFGAYDLPNPSTSASYIYPLNISPVTKEL